MTSDTRGSSSLEMAAASLRVLVADDDAEMRSLLRDELTAEGYQVDDVADGAALRDRLLDSEAQQPQVVIADVVMPHLSGLDALAAVRRARRDVPAWIVISSFADEPLCARAQALGARTVIAKPFDVDQLREALAAAVRDGA